jgi:hypothetical protein
MVSAYLYFDYNFHCRKTICKSACIFIFLCGESSNLVTWTLLLHGEWFKIKLQDQIMMTEHLKQVSPSGSEYDDAYTLQSLYWHAVLSVSLACMLSHSFDLCINESVMLKWMLRKQGLRMWPAGRVKELNCKWAYLSAVLWGWRGRKCGIGGFICARNVLFSSICIFRLYLIGVRFYHLNPLISSFFYYWLALPNEFLLTLTHKPQPSSTLISLLYLKRVLLSPQLTFFEAV